MPTLSNLVFLRMCHSPVNQVRRYNDATFTTLASKTDYTRDGVSSILIETHRDGSSKVLVSYSNFYDELNRITSETRNGVATNDSYCVGRQLQLHVRGFCDGIEESRIALVANRSVCSPNRKQLLK